MDTITDTLYGANGPYQMGIEYEDLGEGVFRRVRRQIVTRQFVGYGLKEGIQFAIEVEHFGELSEWRTGPGGICSPAERVCVRPLVPPYLGLLPDEESGATWIDPLDVPAPPPRWFRDWPEVELTEQAAREAIAAYEASSEPQPGWEERAVDRARASGLFAPRS